MGMIVTMGLILIAVGAVLFVASWVQPGEEPADVL
jgi:uncharacterized membrane protein